jgi:hypothetical protein
MVNETQLALIPEPEHPRKCIIGGEEYASALDLLRIYGGSSNPNRDWKRITEKLQRQGYDLPNLVHHQFRDSSGKLNRPTPVVNKVQIARIAQITDYPAWEPIRQAQAEIFVEQQTAQKAKSLTPKKLRELRASGYTDDEIKSWYAFDRMGAEARKAVVAQWVRREGNIGYLTNQSTKLIMGKSATALKKELAIKVSPRQYASPVEKAAMAWVDGVSAALHIQRDSHGNDELSRDVNDAYQMVDWDKLDDISNKPVQPVQKPIQYRLPGKAA